MMKPFAFAVATVISACDGQFLVHTEEQASLFETEYVEHVTRLGKEFFKHSQGLGPNVDITLHNYLQSVDMLKNNFFVSSPVQLPIIPAMDITVQRVETLPPKGPVENPVAKQPALKTTKRLPPIKTFKAEHLRMQHRAQKQKNRPDVLEIAGTSRDVEPAEDLTVDSSANAATVEFSKTGFSQRLTKFGTEFFRNNGKSASAAISLVREAMRKQVLAKQMGQPGESEATDGNTQTKHSDDTTSFHNMTTLPGDDGRVAFDARHFDSMSSVA
jgi:hypothetical protein